MKRSGFFGQGMRTVWWPVFLLWLALPALAQDLDQRIDSIERAHFSQPWPVSQRMIDELRSGLISASIDQRSRVDLFEARNLMLGGRSEQGWALLDEILERPISLDLRVRALELLIALFNLRKDYEQAFFHLALALELLEDLDLPAPHSSLMEIAARMHALIGEYSLALEYAAQGLAIAESSGDARDICAVRMGLVIVQRHAGLLEVARRGTDELWRVCQRSEDPVTVASSMMLIGWLANAAGRQQEAVGWLRRALEQFETGAHYVAGSTDARLELGRALIGIGEIEQGLGYLLSGVGELEESWLWSGPELYALIAETQTRLGRHDLALDFVARAREAIIREADDQRQRRLAYLQADFEQQRQNLELDLARERNRLLEAREESDRALHQRRLLGIAMISLIAMLLLVLLIRFGRDRRRFTRMSRIDGLTGLPNHRYFHHRASETLADSRETGRPCALVAADVDLFKWINDRHGHRAGDAVLEYLGRYFLQQFPPPAIVGRIGGEEFVFFLPDHNRLQARQRVEQLRHSLQPVSFNDDAIRFTLSFGIAESRGRMGLEQLRSKADAALYRAKRLGRNEVVDAADVPHDGTSAG